MREGPGGEPIQMKTKKKVSVPTDEESQDPCADTHSRQIWIVGCVVIVLVSIFCGAMLNNRNNISRQLPVTPLPAPVMTPGFGMGRFGGQVMLARPYGGQGFGAPYPVPSPMAQQGVGLRPRAIYGPNGPVYPNDAQPMPQYGPVTSLAPSQQNGPAYPNYAQPLAQDPGMQQVAVTNPHAGCPSFTQCFPPAGGGAQPVAFTNPHAGCPSFAQCFPQGSATAVALTQPIMGAATAAATAPPIFRDAVLLHPFRGVCENCHIVSPDIPITMKAQLPHPFRGVCSNCHAISDLPPAV